MTTRTSVAVPERSPPTSELDLLLAAQRGERSAFDELVQPFRRRLHRHCYLMLGSLDEADDAVQEVLLRTWRHLPSFEPKTTVLAWMYRISTNVCLTTLRQRKTRGFEAALPLDPYPDDPESRTDHDDPTIVVEKNEAIRLAFLTAVLTLPPRQRAVVLLRDVLEYPAADVATMLTTSVAAVNSSLQRARATLRRPVAEPMALRHLPPSSATEDALVRCFVVAWENADVDALVRLLTHDAVIAMPPEPERSVGAVAIASFLRTGPADRARGRFRLRRTRANDQPAMAAYLQTEPGAAFVAHAVLVLSLDGGSIASITRFASPGIVERFGLPEELSVEDR